MDDRFFHAFLPPSATICGRRLDRFTLWHHLILSAIGSPINGSSDKISMADLLVAVRVCSLRYGETSLKPGLRDTVWHFLMRRNRPLFLSQIRHFIEWMNAQCSPPKFYRKSGSQSATVDHGIDRGSRCLALVCSLMHNAGMSRAEAWECSLGEAMWMDAQLAQIKGLDIRFLDDADLEDEPIDMADLSDAQALAMYQRDLPPAFVEASFKHWRENIKRRD
jgi:hypothetical protein